MKKHIALILLILLSCFALFQSCSEDGSESKPTIPKLSTSPVTDISFYSAVSGGVILSDGGADITEVGTCFSTSSTPTISDNKTPGTLIEDSFTGSVELDANTTYFIRAYATNSAGIGYGEILTFTTDALGLPTVTTSLVEFVEETSAHVKGSTTSDGGSVILERGFCWSLTTNSPTTADNKISDIAGLGEFDANLNTLLPNGTYYVRSYAINSIGTAYGEVLSFNTPYAGSLYKYAGMYEIVSGSIIRNTVSGPDTELGGNYASGLLSELSLFNSNRVWIRVTWKNGLGISGIDNTSLTINETTNAVTIGTPDNPTLQNTSGMSNIFIPGLPNTAGATQGQEFLLNFEWGTAPTTRKVINLRLRYVGPI